MYGMRGLLLDVDLGTGSVSDYEVPAKWLETHLGGRGLASRLLWEELDPQADPLSADNIVVFCVGPLQGTGFPGAGRQQDRQRSADHRPDRSPQKKACRFVH